MTATAGASQALHVQPLSEGFGARLTGSVLSSLPSHPDAAVQVRRLLKQHRVLVLSGLSLTANDLVAVAGTLGTVRPARVRHPSLSAPACEHLFVSTREASPAGTAGATPDDAGHVWHVDYTFIDPPPRLSMLYGVTLPARPSITGFADMTRVHAALPDALKARIADLRAIHYRHPDGANEIPEDAPAVPLAQRQQGVHHPLVMRDDDGVAALCFPARRDTLIAGWTEADSRALLDTLWPYVHVHGQPWEYALQPGEFQIWDNRALLHRRSAWPVDEARLLWFLTAD